MKQNMILKSMISSHSEFLNVFPKYLPQSVNVAKFSAPVYGTDTLYLLQQLNCFSKLLILEKKIKDPG